MTNLFLVQGSVVFLYANLWFAAALVKGRNDLADIAWGGGFICAALTAFFVSRPTGGRALLLLAMVIIWGLRLMLHLAVRNKGKPEDHRYQAWRKQWGKNFLLRTYLQVFLLQNLLLLIICLPVTWSLSRPSPPLNLLDIIGFSVWLLGFLFEAVSDYQLLQFKKAPDSKGRIMTSGLWRYTRHPNYFGEVTLWWGLFLICLQTAGSLWTIVGPVTLSYLILRVSGTPMLEKHFAEHPEYAEYIEKTSAFFPQRPKK